MDKCLKFNKNYYNFVRWINLWTYLNVQMSHNTFTQVGLQSNNCREKSPGFVKCHVSSLNICELLDLLLEISI
jgi:hypothetical protein